MKLFTGTAHIACALFVTFFIFSHEGSATERPAFSTGQTVYVPVYSTLIDHPGDFHHYLAAFLSIRNTDLTNSITVLSADYYDAKGKLLSRHFQSTLTLAPLELTYVHMPQDHKSESSGGSFIVKWKAVREISAPVIECVMFSAKANQAVSFVSPGYIIKEDKK